MVRMSRRTGSRRAAAGLLFVAAAVFFSFRHLDAPVARTVKAYLHANAPLARATANIPDLLLLLVCVGTAVMWVDYFRQRRNGGSEIRQRFLRLAATATPAAFILKSILQGICGRVKTRSWPASDAPPGFAWLSGDGGFPSGHMLVFTAFFTAIGRHYPRYRLPAAILLFLLAAALILTDYHFLSDVIAGAYLGFLVSAAAGRLLDHFPCPSAGGKSTGA